MNILPIPFITLLAFSTITQELPVNKEIEPIWMVQQLSDYLCHTDTKSDVKLIAHHYQKSTKFAKSWEVRTERQVFPLNNERWYAAADMELKDMIGDHAKEILVYRYHVGSSYAVGLHVFSCKTGKWVEIFHSPSLIQYDPRDTERFEMTYLGGYQLQFHDKLTDLKAHLSLSKERYMDIENREESLKRLRAWVDPVSHYEFRDSNGDHQKEIHTHQHVYGLWHTDHLGTFVTIYKFDQKHGAYRIKEVAFQEPNKKICSRKVILDSP